MEANQQIFYTSEEVLAAFPGNNENSFRIVANFISQLVETNSELLSEEYIKFIHHYKNHDEYEMAFEILVLELIKSPKPANWDSEKVLKCALFLGLDKESVYDDDFFQKLVNYTFPK